MHCITDLYENLIYTRYRFGCRNNRESIHSVLYKPMFNKERRACKKINHNKKRDYFLCRIPWEPQAENPILYGTVQKAFKRERILGLDVKGRTGA